MPDRPTRKRKSLRCALGIHDYRHPVTGAPMPRGLILSARAIVRPLYTCSRCPQRRYEGV